MQRVVGNRMTQRAFDGKSSGLVQRLTTADELIGKAGQPQNDRFFGLKKMSAKYKAVLDALRSYDDRLKISVEIAGTQFAEPLQEQLNGVAQVCTEYITAHGDDPQRTPHITKCAMLISRPNARFSMSSRPIPACARNSRASPCAKRS